jgi:peroxiredoxin
MSEVQSTFRLRPGDPAPDFSLPFPGGNVLSRAGACGTSGLLVVFACNHCPYVIHLAGALGDFAREIAAQGVHTVAINSNDTQTHPQDSPARMPAFAAKHCWEFPYLIDGSQEVAIAYGAACTPDFFLLDAEGRLFYTGQFDDTRPYGGRQAHAGDLREAVRRMVAGEPPPERFYPGSGCNIKWKAGQQPGWWNTGC